jgi:glucose/arabinose dehydrogenase
MVRILLIALLASCAATGAPAQTIQSERHAFSLTKVAALDYPWAMAFLPDHRLLVSERGGAMRLVGPDGKVGPPLAGVPEVAVGGQGGLLDVVLHPGFVDNRLVYFTYSGAGPNGIATRVARARLEDDRLANVTLLHEATPARGSAHFGSRIAFGLDGLLYIAVGDRRQQETAQQLDMVRGKVIRLRDDGSVPPDNPFVGRSGARPEIFTYGHRNPQGLTVHPRTGQVWEVEHGARGGDELNLLRAGANYGWPVVTYGVDYDGSKIGEGTSKPGMEQPVRYWVPSISPSGLAFYTGSAFPRWRDSLFLGGLSGQVLTRLELSGDRVVHEERLLANRIGRIRDVRQGPDGKLWLLTDGAGGALYRLDPA